MTVVCRAPAEARRAGLSNDYVGPGEDPVGSASPALELGCGDGDPLLDLRRRGLDVEGVDSSADMLQRCRRRARKQGVDVVVYHQRMEALDLPRRYRAIFLAGPTFNLLPDDSIALAAAPALSCTIRLKMAKRSRRFLSAQIRRGGKGPRG